MADPQLLVDQADRLIHAGAAIVGHLDVGEGEELEDAVVLAPQGTQLVRRPAALDRRDDLVVVPLVLPAMSITRTRPT